MSFKNLPPKKKKKEFTTFVFIPFFSQVYMI